MATLASILNSSTIHVFDKSQFDMQAIRHCGQIFRDPPCTISDESDKIVIQTDGTKSIEWLWNYFDLDTDYAAIKAELSRFTALGEPIKFGGGIRILRQPFHEVVVSFIISANNNIKRFSKTIAQINFDELFKYSVDDFVAMGCGYRAPYLVKAIAQLEHIDAEELGKLDNAGLRKALMTLPGVGPKVADCIMLFAFHRLDVAPVDTWIRRGIEAIPTKHRYAGVAQQYVFYYLQHLRKDLK